MFYPRFSWKAQQYSQNYRLDERRAALLADLVPQPRPCQLAQRLAARAVQRRELPGRGDAGDVRVGARGGWERLHRACDGLHDAVEMADPLIHRP